MIIKHSTDENPKPLPVGLRLARVISIGNGTVDVCPVGSSVVLHDIPVTSATTMQVGDVINLQMIDNKRFAFAQQNVTTAEQSVTQNITIATVNQTGSGGSGTVGVLTAGLGLGGGGDMSSNVSLYVNAGSGISVSSDFVSVDSTVVRTSRTISAGSGLTGGGTLESDRSLSVLLATTSGLNTTSGLAVGQGDGISVLTNTVAVQRAATSGLTFSSGGLAVGQGNGISIGVSSVAVDQAYAFAWSSAHAFNSGFTAAASTFTGLLTGTSGAFSGGINVGTATGAATGDIRASGNLGVRGGGVTGAAVEAWGAVNALPAATGSSAEAAFRASGGGTNAILDVGTSGATGVAWLQARNRTNYATNYSILINPNGGNLGVNRADPSYPLDVSGSVRFTGGLNVGTTGASTGEIVALSNISGASGTFTGGLNVGSASSAAAGEIRTSSASNPKVVIESTGSAGNSRSFLRFSGAAASEFMSIGYYPDASPRRMHINYNSESASLPIMSLTSTNRVGINTQTPSYTLDVSGDIRASGAINIGTAAGTEAGYLYTSGRIGVGKNAADYPLDVVGDIYSSASVRANTSVITQELTGAGASTSVSLTNGTGFRSIQYDSGFAGNGWRIYRQDNSTKAEWEVDNLTVRGSLSVYELLIQQIRATNGSIFVSTAAKIESVTGTGPYTLIVEGGSSDYAPFAVGDVIRAQRVSLGTSTLVWQSDLTVTGTNSVVNGTANPRAFTATLRSGSTAPAEGMEYVRLGNTTDADRQGAVYLTADDTGAPFIDIVDGIAGHADWGTAGKIKSRIGRLNGILGGATANYGIWSGTGTSNADSWVKMAEDGILLNNVPLKMYNGGNQTVDFAASGNLKIGANVANTSTTALNWDGTTLSIKGNITVTGGDAETTSGAQSKANTAQSTAQTYSDTELAKVVNKSTGKLAFSFATAPTGSGLYLGSTHLGYFNGVWKTYMNSTGQFYLSGTGNQGLTWDGATLSIDGDLTARSGSFEGYVTIGTAGGLYQGTGTGASPTSGLRIRSNNGLGSVELWSGSVVRGVFGNLRSLYDYAAADLYGAAIGPYANSTSHITIEPTNGIRIRNRASDGTVYQVFRVDNSGTMTVGRTDSEYISVDTTNGIRMIDATSTKFQINASGELYIGDTSGSNNNVQITSTELNIRRGTQKMLSLTGTSMTINNSAGSAVITMNNSGGASFSNTITVGTEIGIVPGANPYIAIGGTAYPTGFLAASTTGIWMGSDSNLPKMRVGTTNASGVLTSGMQWDGSSLTVNGAITAQSGSIAGALSVGSSGGIYQGNGTFASPGTGLKIFSSGVNHVSSIAVTATGGTFTITVVRTDTGASATTGSLAYNIAATGATSMQTSLQALSSVGSGNATVTKTGNVYTITFAGARASTRMTVTVATGSLTGGTATVSTVTDGGIIGRIAGYRLGTEQWTADTDGAIRFGNDQVVLNSDGLKLFDAASQSPSSYNTITFGERSSSNYAQIYSWGSGNINIESLTTGNSYGRLGLSGQSITAQGKFKVYYGGSTVRSLVDDANGWEALPDQLLIYGSNQDANGAAFPSGGVTQNGYQNIDYVPLRLAYRTTQSSPAFSARSTNIDVLAYQPTAVFTQSNSGYAGGYYDARISVFNNTTDTPRMLFYVRDTNAISSTNVFGLYNSRVSVEGDLSSAFSSGWTLFNGTFNTNWAHFETAEATWPSVRYKRVGDFVFLKGLIKRTAGTGLSTTAFTLPVNFRPARRTMFFQASRPTGQTGTVGVRVDVLSDGTVNAVDIGTTAGYDFISLDGIFFSVVLASTSITGTPPFAP